MQTKTCPECGDDIALSAASHKCGWRAKPRTTPTEQASQDRNRCAWSSGQDRCWYAGTIGHGTRGDGSLFCRAHILCTDAAHGQRVVQESLRYTGGNAAYSTAELYAATLGLYISSGIPKRTPIEAQVAEEIPRPENGFGKWWAKRIIRLAELGEPPPPRSIEIAREVLGVKGRDSGIDQSPEAIAERKALQSGL